MSKSRESVALSKRGSPVLVDLREAGGLRPETRNAVGEGASNVSVALDGVYAAERLVRTWRRRQRRLRRCFLRRREFALNREPVKGVEGGDHDYAEDGQ